MELVSSIQFCFFTMTQVKVSYVSLQPLLFHFMVTMVTLNLKETATISQVEWSYPHTDVSWAKWVVGEQDGWGLLPNNHEESKGSRLPTDPAQNQSEAVLSKSKWISACNCDLGCWLADLSVQRWFWIIWERPLETLGL